MPWNEFGIAIKDFGFPVALAALLVWHFLWVNRKLTDHNTSLVAELSKLREAIEQSARSNAQNVKLVEQNEKLVEAIRLRESKSFDLVQEVLSVRLVGNAGERKASK